MDAHDVRVPARLVQAVLAAVLPEAVVVGVAVAVYGLQTTPERHHGHMKKLGKLAGGLLASVGGRLWDGLVAMAG